MPTSNFNLASQLRRWSPKIYFFPVAVRSSILLFSILFLTTVKVSAQSDYVTLYDESQSLDDLIDLLLMPEEFPPTTTEQIENSLDKSKNTVSEKLSDASLIRGFDEKVENSGSITEQTVVGKKSNRKFTAEELERRQQIASCLAMYYRMPVDTEKWRPWTIMHGLLPYGMQSQVVFKGKQYNAVEYLCQNAIGNDTYMMHLNGSQFDVSVGPGVQGHEGQFLAMLAQADVPVDQPISIFGKDFTVRDLISHEQLSCKANTELTFKLIGLSHYLDSDAIWRNSMGQAWNIERLIYEEIKQPINGAACGGTHRLMGLSYAVDQRSSKGKTINGQWARAKDYIEQYQSYVMRYQNIDGSFSTNWFETLEADPDLKKRLYTTGHIVEWLAVSLADDQLSDQRLAKAIDHLLYLMLTAPAMDLEIGPKGHALHALRVFESRFYGSHSNVEDINATDLAKVERALLQQQQMQPEFAKAKTVPAKSVGFPRPGLSGNGRRVFRRR